VVLQVEIDAANVQLARLDASHLGRLAATLLPAAIAGELTPNSRVLLALVSAELARREHSG
jgi:hypothetical protein